MGPVWPPVPVRSATAGASDQERQKRCASGMASVTRR